MKKLQICKGSYLGPCAFLFTREMFPLLLCPERGLSEHVLGAWLWVVGRSEVPGVQREAGL